MRELYKKLLEEVNVEHNKGAIRTRNSKVLVIDGLNTFIRCWTTNPTMNEDGDHTGGVVGSLNSIGATIRQFNPTRVLLIFDGKGGSDSRKKIFEGYKADRGKNRFRVNRQYPDMMNEEEESKSMKRQFLWLVDMIDHLPITVMVYDGVEADDVISFIPTELLHDSEECVIVSTDKDFLQHISDKVKVYSPTKKKLYIREVFFEEFGMYPQNFLLFRTLDSDTSDGIPGVKGVGLKTFLKRFPQFSEDRLISFDEFFDYCEDKRSKYKIYDDILQHKDDIYRNKTLMQLSESVITTDMKLKIKDRFDLPNKKFDKISFLKSGSKYKILQNWKDIGDWLNSTFNQIVIE